MDQRERIGDHQDAIRVALDDRQSTIWTSLPGIVQSYDPATNTCSVLPAIAGWKQSADGSIDNNVTLPLIVDVPVQLIGGGGFVTTFPLAQGDEVLLQFCSRCIDTWAQNGKVQVQAELRMHDLSDAVAIPCLWSKPRVPGGISTGSAQLRKVDGSAYLELTQAGVLNIVAPGGINLNGVHIDVSGNTDFGTATVKQNGKHIDTTHYHNNVQPGSGNSGQVAGP